MATDIVPYPDMPGDSVPSPDAVATSRSNAQWATRFEGGTTNLAQRARHAQDIRQYTSDLEAQRAEKQRVLLDTNKDAQNFYLKERAMTLQEDKAHFDMADKRRRADAAVALAPSMLAAKQAQTDAHIAAAARNAAETAAQAKIAMESNLFHTKVAQASMLHADQADLDKAIAAAAFEHPLAVRDPAAKPLIDESRKAVALRQKQAEIDAKATAAGMTPNLVTESGLQTYHSTKPEKPVVDPELAQLKSDLSLALSNQKKAPEADQHQYAPGLEELRKKIAAKEGGTTGQSPDEIKAQVAAGKLSRDDAIKLLREKHGFQ